MTSRIFLILQFISNVVFAQNAPQRGIYGVLDNGFTYRIVNNKDPKNEIAFRLVTKVGNSDEQLGEENVAHFIEHLSMRSTKHFSGGLRNFMKNNGVSTVASTNQVTSYGLDVPSSHATLIEEALNAMHDFANGRAYISSEIEQERQALLNEANIANNPAFFALKQQTYLLLDKNPLYAPRLATEIQNTSSISIETLKCYDKKWYRPDLQHLVIVGDINEVEIEEKVKKMFSELPARHDSTPSEGRYRKYLVPLPGVNKLVVVERKGLSIVRIEILIKRNATSHKMPLNDSQQLKTRLVDELYNILTEQRFVKINNRASEVTIKHELFRGAIHPLAGIDALQTSVMVKNMDAVKSAIIQAVTELKRIQLWNFTDEEIELAKDILSKKLKRHLETSSSREIANALQGLPQGDQFSSDYLQLNLELLAQLNLDDVKRLSRNWIGQEENIDVALLVPNHYEAPAQDDVFLWIKNAMNAKVEPWKDSAIKSLPQFTVKHNLKFKRVELNEIEATKIVLQNGLQVYIKSLDASDERNVSSGQVYLKGYHPGGINSYRTKEYESAKISANLIHRSGISSLNELELKDLLRERNRTGLLFINPYILVNESGIGGRSTLNNINELLHLTYLYFVDPRPDQEVFKCIVKETDDFRRKPSSIKKYRDTLQTAIDGNVRFVSGGTSAFNEAVRIYKEQFANDGNFRFAIVGSFDKEEVIKRVVKYLGAIPRATAKNVNAPSLPDPASIPIRVTAIGDSIGQVDVTLLFKVRMNVTDVNALKVELTSKVLARLLKLRLREQENGAYGVQTQSISRNSFNNFVVRVDFDSSPGHVDRLVNATVDELNKISKGNLNKDIFESEKNVLQHEIQKKRTDSQHWADYLLYQENGESCGCNPLNCAEVLNEMNASDIIELVRDQMDKSRYDLFQLL